MWWWSVKLGGPFLPEEAGACPGLSRKELVSFVSGSLDLSRSDGRSRVWSGSRRLADGVRGTDGGGGGRSSRIKSSPGHGPAYVHTSG